MGSIDQLKMVFDETWDWSRSGEEWSDWWGGTDALWYGAIFPRIHTFLPAGTILEIAPGFGRWTQYLKDLCDNLVLVDLAEKCIDHCRIRFDDMPHIAYHVNDGRSLAMVPDGSVDFIFTWDSLVHADADIISDYLQQFAAKLAPDGVAFLHHSNAGQHRLANALSMRVPNRLRHTLVRRGALLDIYAWRSPTIQSSDVTEWCARNGLSCIAQETFVWEHGPFLTEAISVITRQGSKWDRPARSTRNWGFRYQARQMSALYAAPGFGGRATVDVDGPDDSK